MRTVPGEAYSDAELRVATILYNTYTIERQRHINSQRLRANAYNPAKWKSEIREDVSENVEDGQSAKKSDEWIRLARAILARQMDPELFIRRQFQVLDVGHRPPWPRELGTAKALDNYTRGQDVSRDEIRIKFKTQLDTATTNMIVAQAEGAEGSEAWDDVLGDEDLSLSPLFRYCLSRNIAKNSGDENFKALARRFREGAALQYLRDPAAYEEVWGRDWIPAGFQRRAQEIYDKVYGREG